MMGGTLVECIKCKAKVTKSLIEIDTDEEVWIDTEDHSDCGCMDVVYPKHYTTCNCNFK